MDPLTALVTALTAGAAAGLTDVGKSSVKDAYRAAKTILSSHFSHINVEKLEEAPQSEARQIELARELEAASAHRDQELLQAALELIIRAQAELSTSNEAVSVDFDKVRAAEISIKNVIGSDAGVRLRKTQTTGAINISNIESQNPQKRKSRQKSKSTTKNHNPINAKIEKTRVGGDLKINTLHIYLGEIGQIKELDIDQEGRLHIKEYFRNQITASSPSNLTSENPYKSLEAFQEEDASVFFGREQISEHLYTNFKSLCENRYANNEVVRFLPILGASGSGKSSLVRAGLIPKLIKTPLLGATPPRVAIFSPGARPIEALARVLSHVASGNVADVECIEKFETHLKKMHHNQSHQGLRRIVDSLPDAKPLVLVIDQFEELFSLCEEEQIRRTFIGNVINAAKEPRGRVSVIATLRSDFLDRTVEHEELNRTVAKRAIIIPVMTNAERREIIERPASLYGRTIDAATVDLLIDQTARREGALPLLQFVLSRIWQGMEEGISPTTTVTWLGGVGGALAGEAHSIYESLDSRQRRIAQRAFVALVQLGEGAPDTLRAVYISQMAAHNETEHDVREVLERFANPGRRLVTLSGDTEGRGTAKITHEALLEHWGELRSWVERSREEIRFHRRLAESVENWIIRGRPQGLLWRSPDLDLLKRFYERSQDDMTSAEVEFFKECVKSEQEEHIQKRIHEETARQHTLNQNILDAVGALSVALAIVDEQGKIVQSNPGLGEICDFAKPKYEDNIKYFFSEDDQFVITDILSYCKEMPSPTAAKEIRPKSSEKSIAMISGVKLFDKQKKPHTLLCVVDITERKAREEEYASSQKMLAFGQMSVGIAQDFTNIITAIVGYCDLLLLRHAPGDQFFADLMQIKQNANRAANLVRQLLAFSRQQTLRPTVLSVTDVLVELKHLLRRLIGEDIEFDMQHGRDLGSVKVDHGQLEQVIINLVLNARDAMAESGGRLTIRTRNVALERPLSGEGDVVPPGDYVLVEVSDTGCGIPRENLGRIFEPFFSTKSMGAGTGLGLSTVYGIVKQTGGFILVNSAPGVGSNFHIYLPRHYLSKEELQREEVEELGGSGNLLIVDEEEVVRVFAARALRNKGYNVLLAASAETALELLESGDPTIDLLITDVGIQDLDGPTLVKRARDRWPNLKVLFTSGYSEESFRNYLGDMPNERFLAKPYSLRQLAQAAKEALSG